MPPGRRNTVRRYDGPQKSGDANAGGFYSVAAFWREPHRTTGACGISVEFLTASREKLVRACFGACEDEGLGSCID